MSSATGQEASAAPWGSPATSLGWLAVPVVFCLVLGVATAWISMQQSLWIDELHTAWTCSQGLDQVVPRAAIGNQTPLYFAWQWWLSRTFGQSEVCLRATSLLAWCGCLALLVVAIGRLVQAGGSRHLWWIVSLVALNRHQTFFASEARPYMLLSLVILLGWLALADWLQLPLDPRGDRAEVHRGEYPPASGMKIDWAWASWVACCGVAAWLQPIAILFVAAQFAFATWRTGVVGWLPILIAIVVLSGIVWPMRYVLEPAWQGRQAWAAFAADLRLSNVLQQFPLIALGAPGLIAAALSRWSSGSIGPSKRSSKWPSIWSLIGPSRVASPVGLMWFCAWSIPWLLAILLTAGQVAPLMHARYLFAAAIPLALWAVCMLARLSNGKLVASLVIASLLWQSYQQDNVSVWMAGRLPVVNRAENWRDAIALVRKASIEDPAPVEIYCASQLIEGSRADYLNGSTLRQEYLSLPIRSLYSPPDRTEIVPLLNDPRTWPLVDLAKDHRAANQSQEPVVASNAPRGPRRWMLVRVTPAGLARRLQLIGLQPLEQFDFGAVQLVRF